MGAPFYGFIFASGMVCYDTFLLKNVNADLYADKYRGKIPIAQSPRQASFLISAVVIFHTEGTESTEGKGLK